MLVVVVVVCCFLLPTYTPSVWRAKRVRNEATLFGVPEMMFVGSSRGDSTLPTVRLTDGRQGLEKSNRRYGNVSRARDNFEIST